MRLSALHIETLQKRYPLSPQKILLSGGTGLIGTTLSHLLKSLGHEVRFLVRRPSPQLINPIEWNPLVGIEAENLFQLENFNTVIHLAGENIAAHYWTERFKQKISSSRILSTRYLVQALLQLKSPPQTFICASATGYYGNDRTEELTEESTAGTGFLSEVCQEWEKEASRPMTYGIRSVQLRSGIVLSPQGGALQKILKPFRMGLGGPLGSGRQKMSWISLDDEVASIYHCLFHSEMKGAVNLVAPQVVTNLQFSQSLAKVLSRPCFLRVPEGVLKKVFGEMAEEIFLSNLHVIPQKLQRSGFQFLDSTLSSALQRMLK